MERRPPDSRGRSRSRSPPHQRWASNHSGGLYAPPIGHQGPHFGMTSQAPLGRGQQGPLLYKHEDRRDRGSGGWEARVSDSRPPPTIGPQMVAPVLEHNWRTRSRSSPPAETMRTGQDSMGLLAEVYYTPQEGPGGHNPYSWGGGIDYATSGQTSLSSPDTNLLGNPDGYCGRSQSSDASMRRTSPSFPQQVDTGRRGWGVGQHHIPSWPHEQYASHMSEGSYRREVQGQLMETSWNYTQPRGDTDRGPPVQTYGTVNNVGTAGNVLAAPNYGNIYMESVTVTSNDEFMVNLAERLKVCIRADHRYYAPGEEAALRRGECTPGTRINVLQGVTYWAIDSSPGSERVYWLSGQAGAGKTTIAYTIARQLEAMIAHGDSRVILGASFFCSRQFPDTRSASSIIRTIVYQLALRSKSFQAALRRCGRFETIDHGPRSQLMGLLVEPWESCAPERQATGEPCYVVPIDALDELEAEGGLEFLGTLFDVLERQDLSGLKFFVTSRSHPELVRRIKSFPNKQVCRLEEVPLEESNADIKLYLSQNLGRCATTQQIQQLVSDAAGLFIHAATVVEYLQGRDLGEQKILLERLVDHSSSPGYRPSRGATATLDNLYQQILETSLVDPRDRDDSDVFKDCLSILHTFLCTIERTSTCVVVDILNATRGLDLMILKTGTADGVLHRLHSVLYSQEGKVMWFHKSFVDFLFDESRSQKFFCNQEQHHGHLASSCFGIMAKQLRFNIADISTSYQLDCSNPALAASIEGNISRPLRYACANWSAHLVLASHEALDDLAATLSEFLQLRILFWMEAMNLLGQRGRCHGIIRDTRQYFSKSKGQTELIGKLADAAAFAIYHSTSKAALSIPHLYVSSLATFSRQSAIVQHWRRQLSVIPGFSSAHGAAGEVQVASITTGSPVLSLAVSPDGIDVAVGLLGGLVQIWNLATGEEVRAFQGHPGSVNAVAYSPDGTHVVSGSIDALVRVLDLSTGEVAQVLTGHAGSVHSVAYSPDGAHIVSGSSDESVRTWDLLTGQREKVLTGHTGSVKAVASSPDGTCIVSGSAHRRYHLPQSNDPFSVRMWDLCTGIEVRALKGHVDAVNAVAYSPDGNYVVSGSDDSTVRIWDLSTGKEVGRFMAHTDSDVVLAVAYSPNGTHIASGSGDKSVRVWDLSTGEKVRELNGHTSRVNAVAYSPDGTHIVSGSNDSSIRVWDMTWRKEDGLLNRNTHVVRAIAYSPDRTHIASGSDDKLIRVWNGCSGEEVWVLEGHTDSVEAVAFSPNATHIASGSYDQSVMVWDLSRGEQARVLKGHTHWVLAVAYSPDGTRVVSGSSDRSVRVWDLSAREQTIVLRGHTNIVNAVAYSPDGTHVVSGSSDKSVRVWNLTTAEQARVIRGHADYVRTVAFSPDGTHIVSGSDDHSIRVWDLSTGEGVRVIMGHTDHICAVAYSPSGTHVVSGSSDKSIRVWDLSTGEEVQVLDGHTSGVNAVAYSPHGTHVVSGSNDSTVRVWNVSPDFIPRYVRQRGSDGEYTGWLLSLTDPSAYLMFVPPKALLPDATNVLTLPKSAAPRLDLSNAKLGDRWTECYTPTSL